MDMMGHWTGHGTSSFLQARGGKKAAGTVVVIGAYLTDSSTQAILGLGSLVTGPYADKETKETKPLDPTVSPPQTKLDVYGLIYK